VEDEAGGGVDEEAFFEEGIGADVEASISLDNSAHQILEGLVDPIVWKTELERVGPKLKAQQQLSTNEWRAHVDQTVTSNEKIEKVLTETQADLQIMNK
jgi:intraflagellar transport protein 57